MDEDELELLRRFYQLLMECWEGIHARNMPLIDFTEDVDNDDDEDDDDDFDHKYYNEGDYVGPHCILKGGMKSVLEPLLPKRDDNKQHTRLLLNHKVTKIRDDGGTSIQVETSQGLTIRAQHCCVVTLPIGCLQHDHQQLFDPPLSKSKQVAIETLQMGQYKKVLLTFDGIFWPAQPPMMGLMVKDDDCNSNDDDDRPKLPANHLIVDNLWASQGIPCLEVILLHDAAKWATHRPEEEIRDAVLEFMSRAMKNDLKMADNDGMINLFESCTDVHVTRWEEDEFCRGAYSSFELGCQDQHLEDLQASEWSNRLIFSGEATGDGHEGSVQAALLSGRRAARQVLEYVRDVETKKKQVISATNEAARRQEQVLLDK
jgi:lysine-specific histone demethylase 1